MKRSTPLKRSAAPARKTPIPERNAKRRARLEARNFGEHAKWIRTHRCHTCRRPPRSQASHAKARGMGGCGGDKRECFPQCWDCHRAYERGELLTLEQARAIAATYWARSPHNPERKAA